MITINGDTSDGQVTFNGTHGVLNGFNIRADGGIPWYYCVTLDLRMFAIPSFRQLEEAQRGAKLTNSLAKPS